MHPADTDSLTPNDASLPASSIRDRVIEGALLLVGLRWSMRALSVVRTVVLARLLAPTDFGIFGIALLAIQPLQLLTAMDLDLALIRRRSTTRTDFDTAWTCRAVQRLVVASGLLLLAPFAARYFETAELTPVIRTVAAAVAFAAFENIGVVAFRKELNFMREFVFNALAAVSTLALTIIAAVVMRNYWALVVSITADRVLTTVLSYRLHPYRPRPSLAAVRELWTFARWIPLQNIGFFLRNNMDAFLVARLFGAAKMGAYTVAGGAAGLASELLAPVSTALFPGYAKVAHDPSRLVQAYTDAFGMLALLYVPATLGLALIAPTFVPVVLGAQWAAAVPIVRALAFYNGINGFVSSIGNVLMALGRMRRLTLVIYAQVAVYAPILIVAALWTTPSGLAWARAGVALLLAPVLFRTLSAVAPVRAADIGRAVWRPLIAATLMSGAIALSQRVLAGQTVVSLLGQVSAGALSYALGAATLWRLAGKPAGAERIVTDWFLERSREWRERPHRRRPASAA